MLYNIIIAPIEIIVEWAFLFIYNRFSTLNVIFSIIGVSLVINFLALPLYNIADKLQEKERNMLEQELKEKQEKARGIAEARGRAKFGNGYKASEQDIQKVLEDL